MAHGAPDFGMYAPKTTVGSLADMAELAARLDSVVTHDRRGDVIHIDDFEGNEGKWEANGTGVDRALALSAETARSGMCSLKLTTGNLANNYMEAIGYLAYPVFGKIGYEISYTHNGSLKEYLWTFRLYDGTNYYDAIIRYTQATTILEIDDNGAWRTLQTRSFMSTHYLFNTLKVVIDYNAKKYVRLITNDKEYDISAFSLSPTGSGVPPHIRVFIRGTTSVNFNHSTYLDDFILTQNEP